MLREPGQTVSPVTPYLHGAPSPMRKVLPYLFWETGERAWLVPAATVPPPGVANLQRARWPRKPQIWLRGGTGTGRRAGSCLGQPEPCRASSSSPGTGNTCRTSWRGLRVSLPGRARCESSGGTGKTPRPSSRSASAIKKIGGRVAEEVRGKRRCPSYPPLVCSGKANATARRCPAAGTARERRMEGRRRRRHA